MLQMVNSAFFGLRQRVVDIRTAVSSLGLEMVKTLVLSAEVQKSQVRDRPPAPASTSTAADRHSLLAARIARRLLPRSPSAQDAFSAARLKDIGALVLMSRLPEQFRRIVELARASGRPIWEVETEVLGVTHAEIGAYLLGIWGLPDSDRGAGGPPPRPPALAARPGWTRSARCTSPARWPRRSTRPTGASTWARASPRTWACSSGWA